MEVFNFTVIISMAGGGIKMSTENVKYGDMTIYENIRVKTGSDYEKIDKKLLKVKSGKDKIAEILKQPPRSFAGDYLSGNKVIYGTGFLVDEEDIRKLKNFS